MKKKIIILGSTGSIGKSTLEVIKKDIKNFDVVLLTAGNNYKKIICLLIIHYCRLFILDYLFWIIYYVVFLYNFI